MVKDPSFVTYFVKEVVIMILRAWRCRYTKKTCYIQQMRWVSNYMFCKESNNKSMQFIIQYKLQQHAHLIEIEIYQWEKFLKILEYCNPGVVDLDFGFGRQFLRPYRKYPVI